MDTEEEGLEEMVFPIERIIVLTKKRTAITIDYCHSAIPKI